MNQNELDTPGPEFPVRSDKVPANKTGVQGERGRTSEQLARGCTVTVL